MATHPLHAVADILEKSAEYIDALEAHNASLVRSAGSVSAQDAEKRAASVKTKLTQFVGNGLNDDQLDKLAMSDDPAVTALINKLASLDEAAEMGSAVKTQEKVASAGSAADDRFLNFVLGN
jgi:hypothetical protein